LAAASNAVPSTVSTAPKDFVPAERSMASRNAKPPKLSMATDDARPAKVLSVPENTMSPKVPAVPNNPAPAHQATAAPGKARPRRYFNIFLYPPRTRMTPTLEHHTGRRNRKTGSSRRKR
jgi:hypothetical protein